MSINVMMKGQMVELKEYGDPNFCPDCDFEFRVFEHSNLDRPLLAEFCPFCGKRVICPNCNKPYYECECEEGK